MFFSLVFHPITIKENNIIFYLVIFKYARIMLYMKLFLKRYYRKIMYNYINIA